MHNSNMVRNLLKIFDVKNARPQSVFDFRLCDFATQPFKVKTISPLYFGATIVTQISSCDGLWYRIPEFWEFSYFHKIICKSFHLFINVSITFETTSGEFGVCSTSLIQLRENNGPISPFEGEPVTKAFLFWSEYFSAFFSFSLFNMESWFLNSLISPFMYKRKQSLFYISWTL